jgi:hypothetical protein
MSLSYEYVVVLRSPAKPKQNSTRYEMNLRLEYAT